MGEQTPFAAQANLPIATDVLIYYFETKVNEVERDSEVVVGFTQKVF